MLAADQITPTVENSDGRNISNFYCNCYFKLVLSLSRSTPEVMHISVDITLQKVEATI
jgi:hypothetical protein